MVKYRSPPAAILTAVDIFFDRRFFAAHAMLAPDMSATDPRLRLLHAWLTEDLGLILHELSPASADASFRRYFRARVGDGSFIAMDAPPGQEDVRPFLHVADLLAKGGVRVPGVHARNVEKGFLLLDDFGSAPYLDRLNYGSADALYGDALAMLLRLQQNVAIERCDLPDYHIGMLHREMDLFREWFLGKALEMELDADQHRLLDETWTQLIDNALEQPRVVVHRDYHSRNLMVTGTPNPGVLDFQDAVVGPITYDLVSLLRDCYIAWPRAKVERWALAYAEQLRDAGLLNDCDPSRFLRWFDLMGVQRHLKAIGIFSRLKLRDGKTGYLKDIPRTLGYVLEVGARYPSLETFTRFLREEVEPRLPQLVNGLR